MLILSYFLLVKRVFMVIYIFFSCCSSIYAVTVCGNIDKKISRRVFWLSGSWGIRLVLPGGNTPSVQDFSVESIINQIDHLKTIKYVMININAGSIGGRFTFPIPKPGIYLVDKRMAPSRDLFLEMARALKAKGLRVIAYVAAQGPYAENIRHWPDPTNEKEIKWRLLLYEISFKWHVRANSLGVTPKDLWANLLKDISLKYGSLIDAWWFDYGNWGDIKQLTNAVRSGNKNAAVAWNYNHGNSDEKVHKKIRKKKMSKWILARSSNMEDFTGGHPTPPEIHKPWWDDNYELIEQVIHNCSVDGALAHVFLPLQDNWRAGESIFPIKKAISWTIDIISHNGAITWAAALKNPEFKYSVLGEKQFHHLLTIDNAVFMYQKNVTNTPNQ